MQTKLAGPPAFFLAGVRKCNESETRGGAGVCCRRPAQNTQARFDDSSQANPPPFPTQAQTAFFFNNSEGPGSPAPASL